MQLFDHLISKRGELRLCLYGLTTMSSDQEEMSSSSDTTPDPDAYEGSPMTSMEVMNIKLNMVITKQAVVEKNHGDRLEDLQAITTETQRDVKGLTSAIATLTNLCLETNQKLATQDRPLNYRTRYAIAFTGGLAGGFAGGAVVTLLLKLGLFLSAPAAVAVISTLR